MSDKKARRTYSSGIFAFCAVLAPQVAAPYGVRLSAIPEAYWGTWVPTAEICKDADKSAIVLSAKAYVASAVSCTVDYVAETPSPKGPIYSARLQCSNAAGQASKKAVNLIIRPNDTNQISVGPAARRKRRKQICSTCSHRATSRLYTPRSLANAWACPQLVGADKRGRKARSEVARPCPSRIGPQLRV